MDIDTLCKEISIFVVRRSQKTGTDIFNKFGKLREDALSETDMINMSMNLLGGAFKLEYIEFNPTKEATRNWNGKEPVFYSKYHTLIQTLPHTTPIFLNVSDVHNKNIPYQRNKDKDANKLMVKLNIKPLETDGKYELYAKSIINHEPTQLNYWHVEFQIKDVENNLVSNTKSSWRKNVAEMALKHIICVYASVDCAEIVAIPAIYFKKNN